MLTPTVHVIACGALANELVALKALNNWDHFEINCVPAKYHSTPALIPEAVKTKITNIQKNKPEDQILVAYGECGTMGMLDKVLDETGVKRLPGAHCYQFFAGQEEFNDLHEAEIGTFYLTDFLTQYFETYVWKMLGLDRKPELLEMYFGNYKKLIYLAQTENPELTAKGEECAKRLELEYERIFTAYGEMGTELEDFVTQNITFHNHLNLEKIA